MYDNHHDATAYGGERIVPTISIPDGDEQPWRTPNLPDFSPFSLSIDAHYATSNAGSDYLGYDPNLSPNYDDLSPSGASSDFSWSLSDIDHEHTSESEEPGVRPASAGFADEQDAPVVNPQSSTTLACPSTFAEGSVSKKATYEEGKRLDRWLADVDNIEILKKALGKYKGKNKFPEISEALKTPGTPWQLRSRVRKRTDLSDIPHRAQARNDCKRLIDEGLRVQDIVEHLTSQDRAHPVDVKRAVQIYRETKTGRKRQDPRSRKSKPDSDEVDTSLLTSQACD